MQDIFVTLILMSLAVATPGNRRSEVCRRGGFSVLGEVLVTASCLFIKFSTDITWRKKRFCWLVVRLHCKVPLQKLITYFPLPFP